MQIRYCTCAFVIIERCKPFMVVRRENFVNDQNPNVCMKQT